MVFMVIKLSIVHFHFLHVSSHRLCVLLSSDYSAKPCLKIRSSNLFVFFDIPLSSFIYITYTHTYIYINMLDYHILFFIYLFFLHKHRFVFFCPLSACIIWPFLSKTTKKRSIHKYLFSSFFCFVFSTDVILCMD
jgi:hypothetical protein